MKLTPKYANNAQRQAAYRRRRAQSDATKAQEAGLIPLPAISTVPGTVRWRQALAYAVSHIANVRDEMQAYHDERTERWQQSDKAADFLERLDTLEQIYDLLQEVTSAI
jgi:hypothetical protein